MRCPKCAQENPPNAKFCSQCGAAIGRTGAGLLDQELANLQQMQQNLSADLDRLLSGLSLDTGASDVLAPFGVPEASPGGWRNAPASAVPSDESSVKDSEEGSGPPIASRRSASVSPALRGAIQDKPSLTGPTDFSDLFDEILDGLEEPTEIEITAEELNRLVGSALEILPMETLGLLFGESELGTSRVRSSYVAQNVAERDALSVRPGRFSEVLLRRFQNEASGYPFLGGFHSHPYCSDVLDGNPLKGMQLSAGDVCFAMHRYLFGRLRQYHQLVVGVFPIAVWHEAEVPERHWRRCRSLHFAPYGIPFQGAVAVVTEPVPLNAVERLFRTPIEKEMLLDGFRKSLTEIDREVPQIQASLEELERAFRPDVDCRVLKLEYELLCSRLVELAEKRPRLIEEAACVQAVTGSWLDGCVVRVAVHAVDKPFLRRRHVFRLRSLPLTMTERLI